MVLALLSPLAFGQAPKPRSEHHRGSTAEGRCEMTWIAELTDRAKVVTGEPFARDHFDTSQRAKRWVEAHQQRVRDGLLPESVARLYDPAGSLHEECTIRRGGGQRLGWKCAATTKRPIVSPRVER